MKLQLFFNTLKFAVIPCCLFLSCKGVKQREDQLYSRHLQRQVKLTVINTPVPKDRSDMQLIVFSDGQEFKNLRMKDIFDSLFKEKLLSSVVIVGVHAANRLNEYGVSGEADKADNYDSFFNNELYPYVKKMAGVRKFREVAVAGFGAGGISAFDIAWNHADKISKAGVFSAAFCTTQMDIQDTAASVIYQKLKASRKRPQTKFWFYAGEKGNTGISNDNAANIAACTTTFVHLLEDKKFISEGDIVFTKGMTNSIDAWRTALPDFLIWAAGH
ncbi:MAG: hypothetical protein JST63_16465 [Bacteroidetes bacterium]|nr:hypothetical protein [Bacteroidota bacterium]